MNDPDSVSEIQPTTSELKPESLSTGPQARSKVWLVAIVAIAVIGIDQLTKFLAEEFLVLNERIPLLGDLLGLRLIYNPGAAFSFAAGATWILSILATVVVIAVVRMAPKIYSLPWAWSLALLLGGAVGNLIDRFFKNPGFPQGHVVDFIDYGIFVGNVADIAIVVAAGLMVLLGIQGRSFEVGSRGE